MMFDKHHQQRVARKKCCAHISSSAQSAGLGCALGIVSSSARLNVKTIPQNSRARSTGTPLPSFPPRDLPLHSKSLACACAGARIERPFCSSQGLKQNF